MTDDWKNQLFFGDNLAILREHIPDESADLIYLDPPFNSNATYNMLFREHDGARSDAQITAFDDTWSWGPAAQEAYHYLTTEVGGQIPEMMSVFRGLFRGSGMMAYLAMMAIRILELRRVLKPTGSIYLHCDPTASHYLKLLMDAVFGAENYRTEIVWKRSSAHSDTKQGRKQHGRIHDVILFYTKSEAWTWNQQYVPYDDDYIETFYQNIDPITGRHFQYGDLTGPGGAAKGNPQYEFLGVTRFWRYTKENMEKLHKEGRIEFRPRGKVPRLKRYLDEAKGLPLQSVWTDIRPLINFGKERLGYPTQKPEALLERIIQASSNEGDVVLDPFCGCGTAVAVAERLRRRWIGIDITYLAINLIKDRLERAFKEELAPYEIVGAPKDLASARALAERDKHQFELWALSLVGGFHAKEKKKGADSGIDGIIRFHDSREPDAPPRRIIVQVKGGHVSVAQVRDLKGVVQREGAALGVFITLEPPTGPMVKESVESGYYISQYYNGRKYPKIQVLTIEELLAGKKIDYPEGAAPEASVKHARRQTKQKGLKQEKLL